MTIGYHAIDDFVKSPVTARGNDVVATDANGLLREFFGHTRSLCDSTAGWIESPEAFFQKSEICDGPCFGIDDDADLHAQIGKVCRGASGARKMRSPRSIEVDSL